MGTVHDRHLVCTFNHTRPQHTYQVSEGSGTHPAHQYVIAIPISENSTSPYPVPFHVVHVQDPVWMNPCLLSDQTSNRRTEEPRLRHLDQTPYGPMLLSRLLARGPNLRPATRSAIAKHRQEGDDDESIPCLETTDGISGPPPWAADDDRRRTAGCRAGRRQLDRGARPNLPHRL